MPYFINCGTNKSSTSYFNEYITKYIINILKKLHKYFIIK